MQDSDVTGALGAACTLPMTIALVKSASVQQSHAHLYYTPCRTGVTNFYAFTVYIFHVQVRKLQSLLELLRRLLGGIFRGQITVNNCVIQYC